MKKELITTDYQNKMGYEGEISILKGLIMKNVVGKLIYYDYMISPRAVKIDSHKLRIENHIIHPDATDGYILLGWDEIKKLSQSNLFDLIYILPHENSVYKYNAENQKEYITNWIKFSESFVNARNDRQCGYSDFYVQDGCFLEMNNIQTNQIIEKEHMFFDNLKGPKEIRLVSEVLQLDKYIEQEESKPDITFKDLMSLENSKLFDKVLFCCEDSVYSYFPSLDNSEPERKIDWNNRWWNLRNIVLIDSERDKWRR